MSAWQRIRAARLWNLYERDPPVLSVIIRTAPSSVSCPVTSRRWPAFTKVHAPVPTRPFYREWTMHRAPNCRCKVLGASLQRAPN